MEALPVEKAGAKVTWSSRLRPPRRGGPRGWRHVGRSERDCQGWGVGGAEGPDPTAAVAFKALPRLRFIYSCGYSPSAEAA